METELKGLILTVTLPAEHKRFASTLILLKPLLPHWTVLNPGTCYMYILLAIPATYKHYFSGIEPSHTQKRYNLNLPYKDTSWSSP